MRERHERDRKRTRADWRLDRREEEDDGDLRLELRGPHRDRYRRVRRRRIRLEREAPWLVEGDEQ